MKYDLPKEKEKIDDYLLTACITLLGGFTVLLSVSEPSNAASIAGGFAIVCFVLTLAFTLWHKYRRAVRNSIFEDKKKEMFKEFEEDLRAIKESAKEFTKIKLSNFLLLNIDALMKDRDGTLKRMEGEVAKLPGEEKIVDAFAENWSNKIQNLYKSSYRGPLSEKVAWPKYILEYFAIKGRHFLFILGLLLFLSSLFLNIAGI